MRKILEIFIYVILIMILIIVGLQKISNNNISLFGYRIFRVISLSMEPEYKINDIILVHETDVENIKIGDNIAYRSSIGDNRQVVITHKVIDIEKDEKGNTLFHTKGIANNVEDPLVQEKQVYGIVVSKLYIFSIVNKILNNIYGYILLIYIPLAILIIKNIKELISLIKEKTDEK